MDIKGYTIGLYSICSCDENGEIFEVGNPFPCKDDAEVKARTHSAIGKDLDKVGDLRRYKIVRLGDFKPFDYVRSLVVREPEVICCVADLFPDVVYNEEKEKSDG